MIITYKVQLPHHNFFIATKSKLTPTVIDLREIQDAPIADREAVDYAGPALIQAKSLKHSQSNTAVQIEALDKMLKTEELCKFEDGSTKLILDMRWT